MKEVKVSDIMTRHIITLPHNSTLINATVKMTEKQIGSVVIVKDSRPVGIITEKDIVNFASKKKDFSKVLVAEIMSRPVKTIAFDSVISKAGDMMLKHNLRRLIVKKNGKFVGIITETDLLKGALIEETYLKEEKKLSEDRFKDITQTADEWVWEVDTKGIYTYSSSVVEKILGYKPEEIIGKKHFYDLYDNKTRDESKKGALETFAKRQIIHELHNLNVHKNGKLVWLSTSATPIVDSKGRLLGYRGTDSDITQRKNANELLTKSEAKFKSIITNSDPIIFMINPKGIFELSEGKSLNLLGLKPGQAVGKNAFEMYKDYPQIIKGIKIALSGKTYIDIIEVKGIKGQVYFKITYSPISDKDSRVTMLIGMAIDITKEKLIQEELIKLKLGIERSNDPVIITDIKGSITYINEAFTALYGYGINEVLGKNPRILKSGLVPKSTYELFWKTIKSKNTFNGEFINKKKNGELVNVRVSVNPIIKDNKIIGYLGIQTDMTIQKQLENELISEKDFYNRLLATAPGVVVVLDDKANILFFNHAAEKITGYKEEEVLGKNWINIFINKQEKEEITKIHSDVAKGVFLESHINPILTKDGKEKIIAWNNSQLKDKDVTKVISIGMDITEKIKIEKEKEKLDLELRNRVQELERFQKISIGRELRMVELKDKIIELEKKIKKEEKK